MFSGGKFAAALAVTLLVEACTSAPAPTADQSPAPTPTAVQTATPGALPATPRPASPPIRPTDRPSIDTVNVDVPDLRVGSLANWGTTAWYTVDDSHRVYEVDLVSGAVNVVAEAGRGFPSSIDTNGRIVAWSEWIPKPGRHSSWRIMLMELERSFAYAYAKSSDTRTGKYYDLGSVLDLSGDLLAYSIGVPNPEQPDGSAVVVSEPFSSERDQTLALSQFPFDLSVSESVLAVSYGAVDPEAFGVIVDPMLAIDNMPLDAPQPAAERATNVAVDEDRIVWAGLLRGDIELRFLDKSSCG
jgi:hypothetical protein